MIFGNTSSGLGRTSALLEQGIQASTLRRHLIANNIANVDTPGYKRAELSLDRKSTRLNSSHRL